jgi:dihydropteroate synthase
MGILNVTPDSFSDGGEHDEPLSAIRHAERMLAEGADIIDIGGESTRPGSSETSVAEELARVRPVLAALVRDVDVPVSIDTRHAEVARACVEAGASVVNDVSGFRDPAMVEVAVGCDAGLIAMHMLGEPKTMQDDPRYRDVVTEVRDYLLDRAMALQDAGVACERIAIDPGFGFGKLLEHNLEMLRRFEELTVFGYPVVLAASRKRFIGDLTAQAEPARRVGGSVAAAVWGVLHGASIVRVHDVGATVQAMRVIEAVTTEGEG